MQITGYMTQMGPHRIDRDRFDWDEIGRNPFWTPDAEAASQWEGYLDGLRKSGSSVGAMIEVTVRGCPTGRLAPLAGYPTVRREVSFGRSRLDFLLEAPDRRPCLVEVKSVTLVLDGLGCFPDAVTLRGRRHLVELASAVA